MNIWILIEKNKEFTEFGSYVSLYRRIFLSHHECVVYITELNFWFLGCFSEGLFLKMLHEDVGNLQEK